MPLTCARCGTQNPDGNLYCQACGTPLTAPAAPVATAAPPGLSAGPPPGIAPPMAGSTGYQSPFYTPVGPTPPAHRTPWLLIIAGIVALTLLMAGCGTALAVHEETGRGAAAQHVVHDLQGDVVGVATIDGEIAEQQVRLHGAGTIDEIKVRRCLRCRCRWDGRWRTKTTRRSS